MVALDPEVLVDRRRTRRRLFLWRLLAVLAVAVAAIAIAYTLSDEGLPFAPKSHVAAVDIRGLISGRQSQIDLLRKVKKSKAAKAVLLRIDSPGGTTAGAEILYDELRKLAEEKPVVAVMETVAASGGYIAALASDHIVARGNTITGSIGVVIKWARVDEALASLGIQMDEIKTSPLKGEPDLFGETAPIVRAVTREMVQDSYDWFVGLVAERRPLEKVQARAVSDGRVYTGRQALKVGLIDEIGGEAEARKWLAENKAIDEDLDLVEWDEGGSTELPVTVRVVAAVLGAVGIPIEPALAIDKSLAAQRLDGLLSLWHPELHR